MSKLRRLLLCSALLAGIVLLGAQALGMLTAHRHLSRQLAQQSESGARTLAWVLGRAPSTPHEREVLADELYSQGCTHVSGLPTRHPATAWIAAGRHHGRHHGRQLRRLARTLVLLRAPAVSPLCQPRRRRARHGHRPGRRHAGERYALAGRRPRRGTGAERRPVLGAVRHQPGAPHRNQRVARHQPARARPGAGRRCLAIRLLWPGKRRPGPGRRPPPGRRHGRGAERADRVAAKRDPPRRRHLAAEPQVFHGPFPRGAERPDRRGGRPPAHVPPARPGADQPPPVACVHRPVAALFRRPPAQAGRRARRLPGAAGPDRRLRFRPVDAAQQRTASRRAGRARAPRAALATRADGQARLVPLGAGHG